MSIEAARPRRQAGALVTFRRQAGVTLIELVMFIMVIGLALAGIIGVMSFTTANSADPLRRKQALMIAEGLLEEVQLAGFTFCDPRDENADSAQQSAECTLAEGFGNEGASSFVRPFDNVNDYVAAAGTPAAPFDNAAGVLADALGRPLGVDGYRATVTIVPERLGDIAAGSTAADSEALRIRIAVSFDGGEPVLLDGYRARYAPIARGE
ncbi:type IV pilus modification PilV family protein [Massilia sp. GCM10023247]|uniref:type IV pilus modification PilV family protein n=1 Tax=Massilia sp. GCM10023247 TaxID=3252643 RepID=UPI00361F9DEF